MNRGSITPLNRAQGEMMTRKDHLIESFTLEYGAPPDFVVRAPGRVNLIGEHTDYNDGFVLPMAIDRSIWIAARQSEARRVVVHSLDFAETAFIDFDDLQSRPSTWVEYLKGVAWALKDAGYELRGWDGMFAGDIPIGAGLSSSAALELGTARIFSLLAGFTWDIPVMARLCQKAENQWVGVQCGVMDQMVCAGGEAGHAMLIDCRSLEFQLVPLPSGTAILIMDTATRRGLRDSEYNLRRWQCEEAVKFFHAAALRDVSLAQFEAKAGDMDDLVRRRARHVISENQRTMLAAAAMHNNNPSVLGELMNASHRSLREDFEVSSRALDVMVECALEQDGCFGARMTGAGFGGCAIALVRAESTEPLAAQVAHRYQQRMEREAEIFVCSSANGVAVA